MRGGGSRAVLKISAGIAVTGLALWLSLRRIDWQALEAALREINLFWVALATANSLLGVYLLGCRWRILLQPKAKIPMATLFRLNIISQYANILMPARLGEIVRAYLVTRVPVEPAESEASETLSVGFVMGTMAIEKIFDFSVFLALWIFAPVLFALKGALKFKGYGAALFLCTLAAFLLLLLALRPENFVKLTATLSRLLPQKLRKKLLNFVAQGVEPFVALKSTKTFALLTAWTLGLILNQALTNFLLFNSLHLNLPFWAGLFVLLAIQVGLIPPSIPGKIGVFEYAVILALSAFTVPRSAALGYAIILHLVAFLPKIILGAVFIGGGSLKKNKCLN